MSTYKHKCVARARARGALRAHSSNWTTRTKKMQKIRDLTPMSFRVDNPSLFRLVHSYMYGGGVPVLQKHVSDRRGRGPLVPTTTQLP